MASWWEKLKEFNRHGLFIDRIEGCKAITLTGYVLDRRVFRVAMVLIAILILHAGYIGLENGIGWREMYFHCPDQLDEEAPPNYFGTACVNPFYLDCEYAECQEYVLMETVPAGTTMGRLPPEEFTDAVNGIWKNIAWILAFAFFVNHVLHNIGRDPLLMFFDWREIEVRE